MSQRSHQGATAKHAAGTPSVDTTAPANSPGAGSTSKNQDHTGTSREWTSYFTPAQWTAYGIIIVVGLLLRWTLLDMRPYHHDESLHGMYGRYFYDFPNSNYYKYDPMLHGPMLYNCMRFIYAMFGDSLWAARVPVCVMGSLFMVVPLLYRSYLKRATTLIITATIAFSPTMIYWSRFLREDYWVLSGMLFTLFGFTIAPRQWKPFLVFFGITVQWCTKENIFVSVALLTGFLVFEAAFRGFILKEKDLAITRIFRFIKNNPALTGASLAMCALIFCWFYGAGFRYSKGIFEGLGSKAIEYWSDKHKIERIKGPFNFHVYVTAWYELPIFIAFLTHVVLFYRHALPGIRFCAAVVAMATMISCYSTQAATIEQHAVWKIFKLKNHLDIIGLFLLLFHAPLVTIQHMIRGEKVLATAGYFFTATFFSYSYLGEKVPWLSVYPLVYSLPYLALFFQDYFERHPVDYKRYPIRQVFFWVGNVSLILGCLFVFEDWGNPNERFSLENKMFLGFGLVFHALAAVSLFDTGPAAASSPRFGTVNVGRLLIVVAALYSIRGAVQTNFLYPGKETEYLSQVHTTYELAEYAKNIIDEATYERHGFKPRVYATGESTWPLTWYFRNIPQQYQFSLKNSSVPLRDNEEIKDFAYIFISWKEKHDPSEIPEGYIVKRINLRGWWVPDFNQISLKRFLRYAVNHYPWNTSGFSYATMMIAKDMERFRK